MLSVSAKNRNQTLAKPLICKDFIRILVTFRYLPWSRRGLKQKRTRQ